MKKFGGVPTEQQIRDYAFETLKTAAVVPGYGHAVLRVTDPRFTGFNQFGKKYLPNDPVFQTVDRVFQVVPKVLEANGVELIFQKLAVKPGKPTVFGVNGSPQISTAESGLSCSCATSLTKAQDECCNFPSRPRDGSGNKRRSDGQQGITLTETPMSVGSVDGVHLPML